MRLIKDLNEFDNLNEGILSSLLRGAKNLLSSDKGKLEDILRKIKKAREEEVENSIKIEKQIASISKEDSVDSRFALTNLRKKYEVNSPQQ